MLKRSVWFIFLLVGLIIAQPSSYLVGPENFVDPSFPPAGWTTEDLGGANSWYRPAGNEVAQIDGNGVETENDWLITPSFDGTAAADSIILNYWYQIGHWSGNTGEALVAISTDNGVTWAETVAVYPAASGTEVATEKFRIDNLSTPLSGTTKIGFLYQIYNGLNMMVDSIWVGLYMSEPAPPNFDHATYFHAVYPYTYASFPETVYIDDATGVSPSSAEICYDVDRGAGYSGTYTCISMSPDVIDGNGRGTYVGEIPGQPGWSTVSYYFSAEDTYIPSSMGYSDTFELVVQGNYYAYDNTDPYPEAPDNVFRDITGVGADLGISSDDDRTSISLPFVFRFYGNDYSTIWVGTNGWLVFGADPGTDAYWNESIPTTGGEIDCFVAPLWDDLTMSDGAVYSYSAGDTFIIEWYNARELSGSIYYNFEVMLINPAACDEPGGNGEIIVKYETIDATGLDDATLGIENEDGTIGVEYLYDGTYGTETWVVDGAAALEPGPSAIKYTPTMPPAGLIRGYVTLEGETDHSGVEVTAMDGASFTAYTDPSGYYELTVTEGTYDVYAFNGFYWESETSYAVVVAVDETVDVNFSLSRLPIATVYQSDFEGDDGNLTPNPTTGGWEWGEPTYGPAAAHSGINVWATGLDGNYGNNADYRLETASFDFSSFEPPIVLTYWQWYDIEEGFYGTPYDGGNIKISTDGGSSWNVITPDGGYPASGIVASALSGEDGYSGDGTTWTQAQFDLSVYAGVPDVMVRWHFGSDGSGVYPGWYIDDVAIDAHLTSYAVIRGNVILSGESDHSGVSVVADGPITSSYITASDGSYTLLVAPGDYIVTASKEPAWAPESSSVSIAEGETLVVNFILNRRPMGYVLGYVDLTDTPGADAGILCELLGTDFDTLSDASGGYFFEAVEAGTYAVMASYFTYGTQTSSLFNVVADETTYVDTIFLSPEPLYIDFEADDGGFVPDPTTGAWEWGTPTWGPSAAHSGVNCWGTDLDDDYVNDADWKLIYDISSYSSLITEIDFYHWYDMENSWDGGNISVSTDGGTNWIIVYPDGGYDDNSIFGLSGEPGYTGTTSDWTYARIDLSAYTGSITHIRFRLGTDSSVSSYAGWYVDDVLFPVLPQPEGCVKGYVYDAETFNVISGATVTAGGVSTTTDASGYFVLCGIPAGYYPVNGFAYGYAPNYVNTVIAQNDTSGPIYIPLNQFIIDPSLEEGGLVAGLAYGEDDSAYFTICNPNDEPITLGIGIAPPTEEGGLFRSTPSSEYYDITGKKLNEIDIDNLDEYLSKSRLIANNNRTSGRGEAMTTSFSGKAVGEIVDSFELAPEASTPWGFGCIGLHTAYNYWISSITATGAKNLKYDSDGEFTGTFYNATWSPVIPDGFAGDMTYDGEYIWQVNVGGDNALYQWDPHDGTVISTLTDPTGWWDFVSQRGVGYDAALDIFYIAGWNDDVIYEIKGTTWDNPGEIIRAWASPYSGPYSGPAGVSFHPTRRTVWCCINDADNHIFEFDPATGYILNVFTFDELGDYALAGCEVDANGLLWFVSMNQEKAYAVEIPGGAAPPGVAIVPTSVTIPANACTTIYIVSSGLGAPGIYDFDIVFTYEGDTILNYPAQITISRDIRMGWNLISVPVDAEPNNIYTQFCDDIVPFYNEPGHSNIFAWDPERGMWTVPTQFERGVGYYLLAWRDHARIDVIGAPYYDDFTMNLPYYPGSAYEGWNLVGNPVNTRIDWDNIVADALFDGLYPTYYNGDGGSYSPGLPTGADRYIDPFEGFFVVVEPGEIGVLPVRNNGIFPVLAKTKQSKMDEALPEFILRMGVTVGSTEDKWNYLGLETAATDGFDPDWDALVPPTMTDDYLSFACEGYALMRDLKGVMADGTMKTWEIIIDNASTGDDVLISWPMDHIPNGTDCSQGMNQIYEGYQFQLYDPVADEYVNMREIDHYSFTFSGTRTLYVIVNASALGAEDDKLPKKFALMQNTPNPFNATTEISFALPVDENVSLDILDINGRVVKTLVNGELEAGYHTIVWNGKNVDGSEVSSGVYFYRLTAGRMNETRKMMLIK